MQTASDIHYGCIKTDMKCESPNISKQSSCESKEMRMHTDNQNLLGCQNWNIEREREDDSKVIKGGPLRHWISL